MTPLRGAVLFYIFLMVFGAAFFPPLLWAVAFILAVILIAILLDKAWQ